MKFIQLIALSGCLSGVLLFAEVSTGRPDNRKPQQSARRVRQVRPARKSAGIFGTNIQLTKDQEQEVNRLFEQYRAQLNTFANLCGNFPSVFLNRTPSEWDSCMDDSFTQLKITLQGIRDFVLDAWRKQQRGLSSVQLALALRAKSIVIDEAINRMLQQQRADWKHLTYNATGSARVLGAARKPGVRRTYRKIQAGHLL
jgi:hypothetical protein